VSVDRSVDRQIAAERATSQEEDLLTDREDAGGVV
jgi:hypothetical protein